MPFKGTLMIVWEPSSHLFLWWRGAYLYTMSSLAIYKLAFVVTLPTPCFSSRKESQQWRHILHFSLEWEFSLKVHWWHSSFDLSHYLCNIVSSVMVKVRTSSSASSFHVWIVRYIISSLVTIICHGITYKYTITPQHSFDEWICRV